MAMMQGSMDRRGFLERLALLAVALAATASPGITTGGGKDAPPAAGPAAAGPSTSTHRAAHYRELAG